MLEKDERILRTRSKPLEKRKNMNKKSKPLEKQNTKLDNATSRQAH